MKKTNKILLLLLIFLSSFFIVIRFIYVNADPDTTLTWSVGTFVTDETYHGGNALKKYLTDSWLLSDFNYMTLMPVMPALQYLSFKIYDVSLFSTRLPAISLSILLMILLGVYIYEAQRNDKKTNRLKILILYIFIIGTNYYFFIYGKMALLDIPMASIGFISLFLFYKAYKGSDKYFLLSALSGIFLGLSLLTKTSAANLVFTITIFLIIDWLINKKLEFNKLKIVFITFSFTALVYFVSFKLTASLFSGYTSNLVHDLIGLKVTLNPFQILKLFITSLGNAFVINNLPLFLLLFMNILLLVFRISRGYKTEIFDNLMFALLISTFIFHGVFNYHPPRYYIILSVPLAYFVCTLPSNLHSSIFLANKTFSWNLNIKRILFFSVLTIIVANSWNMYRLTTYFINPEYSFYNTAKSVKAEIVKSEKQNNLGKVILLDNELHTSLPFATGLNFDYGNDYQSYIDNGNSVYIINPSDEQLSTNLMKLLGSYTFFERYKLKLYEIKN